MKSKAVYNPYSSLTDELVEAALQREFGKNASLVSYKVVDFTKKGDNYASFVTSVEVNYKQDGEEKKHNYIVKLNNGHVTHEVMADILRFLYLREPLALDPIISEMNKNMEQIGQHPIRAPKCFVSSSEKGKEILLSEDLRIQHFVMFDKNKKMDMKHAKFVVEELGRFHASSLVYDEKLKKQGTSMEELYPSLDDPYFHDPDHHTSDAFGGMVSPQIQMSIDILNNVRESPHINKWWETMTHFSSTLMIRTHDPSDKFDVLVHGDCWNNNMLFKYNEDGDPIDYRLVDFQMVRRGPPVGDLLYFFYASLYGDVRVKNKKRLMVLYYLAFEKILLLNKLPVPFTFKELEEDFTTRMPFGGISGMLLLPTTLVKPEHALNVNDFMEAEDPVVLEKRRQFFEFAKSNPHLKERFLSMFDEMTAAGMFDNTKTICNPYKILTEDLVEKALKNDIGSKACLFAFTVKKLIKKGENVFSKVVGINVYYTIDGSERQKTSYVVKMKCQGDLGGLNEMFEDFYKKEAKVLTTIADGMNEELKKINLQPLRLPNAYACCVEPGKEIIIAKNFKTDGFVMFDRRKGMNSDHCLLAMKELGRFHASSLLYEDQLKCPIQEKFKETFADKWKSPGHPIQSMVNNYCSGSLENTISLLTGLPKYSKILNWLQSLRGKISDELNSQFKSSDEKFNVLTHGDFWNNNILFKYDDNGNPVDIRIVDFQACSVATVGKDLNYFLYTSTNGDVRKENKNRFLIEYYISFCEVLMLANKPVPFSFEELKSEVNRLMYFGCIAGTVFLSFILLDSKKFAVTHEMKISDSDGSTDPELIKNCRTAMLTDENVSKRFLSMFDDLIEENLVPEV